MNIIIIIITKLNILSMKTLLKKPSDIFFGTSKKFRDNTLN